MRRSSAQKLHSSAPNFPGLNSVEQTVVLQYRPCTREVGPLVKSQKSPEGRGLLTMKCTYPLRVFLYRCSIELQIALSARYKARSLGVAMFECERVWRWVYVNFVLRFGGVRKGGSEMFVFPWNFCGGLGNLSGVRRTWNKSDSIPRGTCIYLACVRIGMDVLMLPTTFLGPGEGKYHVVLSVVCSIAIGIVLGRDVETLRGDFGLDSDFQVELRGEFSSR